MLNDGRLEDFSSATQQYRGIDSRDARTTLPADLSVATPQQLSLDTGDLIGSGLPYYDADGLDLDAPSGLQPSMQLPFEEDDVFGGQIEDFDMQQRQQYQRVVLRRWIVLRRWVVL